MLIKGKVKSTFNYIVNNLSTYAEPLLQHVARQPGINVKGGFKETRIKKKMQSPGSIMTHESTLPASLQNKIPIQLLRDVMPIKTGSRSGNRN